MLYVGFACLEVSSRVKGQIDQLLYQGPWVKPKEASVVGLSANS